VLTKVEKRVGDAVAHNDTLFLYSYTTTVKEGSRYSEEDEEVEKTFVAHFASTLEGKVTGWRVWRGTFWRDREFYHLINLQLTSLTCFQR